MQSFPGAFVDPGFPAASSSAASPTVGTTQQTSPAASKMAQAPPMYFPVPTVPIQQAPLMQYQHPSSKTDQSSPQQSNGVVHPSHYPSQTSYPYFPGPPPYTYASAYAHHQYQQQHHQQHQHPQFHPGYYSNPHPPRHRTLSAQQLAEIQARQAAFLQRKTQAEQKAARARTESAPSTAPPPVPLATRPRPAPPSGDWPTPEAGGDRALLVPPGSVPARHNGKASPPKVAIATQPRDNVLMDGSRLQRLAQATAGPPSIPPIPLPDVSGLTLSGTKDRSITEGASSLACGVSVGRGRTSSPFDEDHDDDDGYDDDPRGAAYAFNPFTPTPSSASIYRDATGLAPSFGYPAVPASEIRQAANGFAIFPALPGGATAKNIKASDAGPSIWNEPEPMKTPPGCPVVQTVRNDTEKDDAEDRYPKIKTRSSGSFVPTDWDASSSSSSGDDSSSIATSDDRVQSVEQQRPVYGPPVVCLGANTKNIPALAPITPPKHGAQRSPVVTPGSASPTVALAHRRAAMRRAAAEREQLEARRLVKGKAPSPPVFVATPQPPCKLFGWATAAASGLRASPPGGTRTPTSPYTPNAMPHGSSASQDTPVLSPVVLRSDGGASSSSSSDDEPSELSVPHGGTLAGSLAAEAFNALGLSFEIGGHPDEDDAEAAATRQSKQRMASVDSTASSTSSDGGWEEVKRVKHTPASGYRGTTVGGAKQGSRFGAIGQKSTPTRPTMPAASQKLQPAIQRKASVPPIVWQEGEQIFRDFGHSERRIVRVVGFSKLPSCQGAASSPPCKYSLTVRSPAELARVFFEPRDKVFRRLPQPGSITAAALSPSSPWARGAQSTFVVLLLFDGELEASRLEQIAPRGVTFDQAARLVYTRVEGSWSHAWPKDAEWMDCPQHEEGDHDGEDYDHGRLPATKAMNRPKLSRPVAHGHSAVRGRRAHNVQHVRSASQERRRRAAVEQDRERFRIERNEEIAESGKAVRMKHGKGSKAPFGASFAEDKSTAARKKDAAKARLHANRR